MRAIYLLVFCLAPLAVLGCSGPANNSAPVDSDGGVDTPAATGVADLVKQLAASEEAEQRAAVIALADMGPGAAEAVDALSELLKDDDASVRAHSARALGEIGEAAKPAAEALAVAMADEDEDVRLMAVSALSKIKPGKDKVVALMLKAMADKDYDVVLRATHALSSVGPGVVEPMIEALGNDKTAYWAILVLHDLGEDAKPAVPALLKVFEGGNPESQMAAVEALGDIGDPAAIPKLIEVLKDHPFDIEINAAFALSKFGPAAKDAAPYLDQGLESDDPVMQTVCAYSLAMIFPEDADRKKVAIDFLLKGLQSDEQKFRVAAAGALIKLNPDPEIMREPFLKAFESADEASRTAIFDAVASVGEKFIPRLQNGLKEAAVRKYAARALGQIGPAAAVAVPDMVAAMEGESAEVREQILMAIGHIGEGIDGAAPAAHAAFADDDPDVRRAAIFVLGQIGPGASDAAGDLHALLSGDNEDIDAEELAVYAAWALVHIDAANEEYAKAAVPHLIGALKNARVGIRVEAAQSLGKLGAKAKDAVAALKEAAEGASDEEKAVYSDVLDQIGG